jgi:transposase
VYTAPAPLREENKALKKELYKKDKALAEVSARVILLKKSRLLWGEPEDEE